MTEVEESIDEIPQGGIEEPRLRQGEQDIPRQRNILTRPKIS